MLANLNRRKFFGVGAGAVVAAPVAAKQLGQEVAGGIRTYRHLPSIAHGMADRPPDPDPEWTKKDLVNCTQRLAEIDEHQPPYHRAFEPVIEARIDGLRSVSPVNKARMILEAREDLHRQSQRSWLQREIDDLKKKLGPLGGMLG